MSFSDLVTLLLGVIFCSCTLWFVGIIAWNFGLRPAMENFYVNTYRRINGKRPKYFYTHVLPRLPEAPALFSGYISTKSKKNKEWRQYIDEMYRNVDDMDAWYEEFVASWRERGGDKTWGQNPNIKEAGATTGDAPAS
jgi:hypothetical protein